MVLGCHLTFGAYGFWLPNDPRGSWSQYVGSRQLYSLAPATKVVTRDSTAHVDHDDRTRVEAKSVLQFPAVNFSGLQARAIGEGFAIACREANYQIYACAILPAHIHLVIGRHTRRVRRIASHLKAKASMQLIGELWPYADDRPLWERGGWTVFLDDVSMMFNAIRYVEANPLKDGCSPQRWTFVEPYEVVRDGM